MFFNRNHILSTLDLTGFFEHQVSISNPTHTPTNPTSKVTKVSSCHVINAIKRQGIEQVGRFLCSIFCLISLKVDEGVLIVARGRPHPLALSNSSV